MRSRPYSHTPHTTRLSSALWPGQTLSRLFIHETHTRVYSIQCSRTINSRSVAHRLRARTPAIQTHKCTAMTETRREWRTPLRACTHPHTSAAATRALLRRHIYDSRTHLHSPWPCRRRARLSQERDELRVAGIWWDGPQPAKSCNTISHLVASRLLVRKLLLYPRAVLSAVARRGRGRRSHRRRADRARGPPEGLADR